jgi:hypothetical protein
MIHNECKYKIVRYYEDKTIIRIEHLNEAEEQALTIPVIIWRFCAYKTKKDYDNGKYYFVKDFLDHTKMKIFSGEHSAKEKSFYPDYCSMYWKIKTNAT